MPPRDDSTFVQKREKKDLSAIKMIPKSPLVEIEQIKSFLQRIFDWVHDLTDFFYGSLNLAQFSFMASVTAICGITS